VHVWSLGFVFLVSLRGRLLVLEGLSQWMPALAAATAGLNLALNVWLIPRLGVVGAAWAATTAWGFSALLAPVLFPPIRQRLREFWAAPAKP
jgi:Na+-driven multidrug efflux pump